MRLVVFGANGPTGLQVTARAVAEGQDAVVSALGAPFGRGPVTVYSEGAANIGRSMAVHGVRRLVCVTSTALERGEQPGEGLLFRKVVEPFIVNVVGRTVYTDMRRMEDAVRRSGLDWTIVRPAGLFDAAEVSDYRVARSRMPGRYTSRADLAHLMVDRATSDRDVRAVLDVRTTQGVPGLLDVLREEALGARR